MQEHESTRTSSLVDRDQSRQNYKVQSLKNTYIHIYKHIFKTYMAWCNESSGLIGDTVVFTLFHAKHWLPMKAVASCNPVKCFFWHLTSPRRHKMCTKKIERSFLKLNLPILLLELVLQRLVTCIYHWLVVFTPFLWWKGCVFVVWLFVGKKVMNPRIPSHRFRRFRRPSTPRFALFLDAEWGCSNMENYII